MKRFYRVSEAAELLGVCAKTIRRWDSNGNITCIKTVGRHRRISRLEIQRIQNRNINDMDGNEKNGVAIYCRVSSHEQKKKGDLQRQIETAQEFCNDNMYSVDYIFKDVGSGLNTNRNGLKKLSKLIEERKVNKIVITYKDRLTRFGFDYLKSYYGSCGVDIISLNQTKRGSVQEELVQDLIAIVTSFSGKVHGLRSHSRKKWKSKKVLQ